MKNTEEKVEAHWLWPSLVIQKQFHVPEKNSALTQQMMKHLHRRGVRGKVFLRERSAELDWLADQMLDMARTWLITAEVNLKKVKSLQIVNGSSTLYQFGEHIPVHIHGHVDADLVGVYYPATGVEDGSLAAKNRVEVTESVIPTGQGSFLLLDPNSATHSSNVREKNAADYFEIKPKPGMLVMFPNRMFHQSTPHLGSGVRVVIAANIKCKMSWEEFLEGEYHPTIKLE